MYIVFSIKLPTKAADQAIWIFSLL